MRFHSLFVKSVQADTAHASLVTLAIPPDLRDTFDFKPGQFVTLKALIGNEFARRSYSICSSTKDFEARQELTVGIKCVQGGVFSTWAQTLQAGDELDVMPPDGRFTPKLRPGQTTRRLYIAAGSGITPIMSILRSTLNGDAHAHAQLIYANQTVGSIMFHEALQDLKDRFAARFSWVNVLSRQKVETPLFNGRLDAQKLGELLAKWVGVSGLDEVFICGPEGMIEASHVALQAAGVPPEITHSERFGLPVVTSKSVATTSMNALTNGQNDSKISLSIVLDGVRHSLKQGVNETVLDAALAAGLELPYSCKAGVCCTCRAKVLEGSVTMLRNFTLEPSEIAQGFVLSCQACPTSTHLELSFDER